MTKPNSMTCSTKKTIKLLAGCAPCQPFSQYTQNKSKTLTEKWSILDEFSRLINLVRPHFVTMENVPGIMKHDIFAKFIKNLKKNNYHVSSQIVYCPDYGIPQSRRRLVVLASLLGEIDLIPPSTKSKQYKTVKDTISRLHPIAQGSSSLKDKLHTSSSLSTLNLKRIKASNPGGSWLDWDKELITACHRKEGRKTYRSVYGRMSWDKPSPTITTQFNGFGNGRFGHPEQDRANFSEGRGSVANFPQKIQVLKKRHAPSNWSDSQNDRQCSARKTRRNNRQIHQQTFASSFKHLKKRLR